MLSISPVNVITYLQGLPTEVVSILSILICYVYLAVMVRLWQAAGAFVYTAVAVIACNLQILKAAYFTGYDEPVALGTLIYSSTFLASDFLTERYGISEAKKSIGLSFAASLLLLIIMLLTLGHKPLGVSVDSEYWHFDQGHNALAIIFNPNAAILIASLTAYIVSQLTDILVYSKLKRITNNNHLWLRAFTSISLASLIDAIIFNFFAWKLFSPNPVSWHSLFFTYIIGAYILQVLVALLNIPALYVLLRFARR